MADLLSTPSPPQGLSGRASPNTTGEKNPQPRIRRRNRLITSCLECRRRKLKCDKLQPCTNCTKFSRDCLYIAPALDPAGQAKIADLKERMGLLEKTLEQDVARGTRSKSSSMNLGMITSPPLPGQEEGMSDPEDEDDVKGLEPSGLAIEDAAYYEDDDANEDLVDLGIAMGKLRITERVGGFVRPRLNEELAQAIARLPRTEDPSLNPFLSQSPNVWMAPGQDYVAPSSTFLFAPGVHKTTLLTHLPSKVMVDKLMHHYWRAVHIIARTVHRPTFERQYDKFWSDIATGVEPRASFQGVVFAALLSATVSLTDERVLSEFGVARDSLVDNFKEGAEAALARSNLLHTTKLETLQAFVMYLIPLCRAEVTRAHSALTGTCIRLAECMSLHRDPSHYTSSPIEQHIRRLIWYQICFLDLRTCEATGPRPQIRREEFDTHFPTNVDDIDIENGIEVNEDRSYFTDMTITRMRIECYEMHRVLWIERPKLDTKRTTVTSLLSKIQKFCQAMEQKYLPLLHKSQPLHVLAMEIYGILSSRMYIMVLQKFVSTHRRLMPERLRQMTMSCAILLLEHGMTIEQTPVLADWAWYVGALHQNHTALLLLYELYASPDRDPALEARVWRCLDFVFDLPASLPGDAKTRIVLEELKGRIEMYHALRRVRAPSTMGHAGPPREGGEGSHQRAEVEAPERDRRSSSVQSGVSSNFTGSSGGSTSQAQHAHQQPHVANLSGLASLDYGLGRGSTLPSQSTPELHPFNFATAPHGMGVTGGISPGSGPTSAHHQQQGQSHHGHVHAGHLSGVSSDVNSDVNVAAGGMGAGTGGSPLDMLPEIDWNEWDQLFGAAEMPAGGDILIPPFTFPQLSATDLQWHVETGLQ